MSDTNGLYVGRQRGTVPDRASDETNPPPVPVRMTDDRIETLLHWVYGDQMAHVGGLGDGVFDGYGGATLGYGIGWSGEGPRPAQLYAAMGKTDPLADWVHRQVRRRLASDPAALSDVVTLAALKRRPEWPVLRLVAQPTHVGRPIGPHNPPVMRFGPERRIRCRHAPGGRVTVREPYLCVVERAGPDVPALIRQRAAYRRWVVAMGFVAEHLRGLGVPLVEWDVDVPALKWWER